MAMKKKFLGLAMASAIALPATSVYAYNVKDVDGKKVLNMDSTETGEVTIPVEGTVTKKDGTKPEKIEVELPTTMAFTVDPQGAIAPTKYTVTNNSDTSAIEISVGAFQGGLGSSNGAENGIQVLSKDDFETKKGNDQYNGLYRNQVALVLTKIDAQSEDNIVDLGSSTGDRVIGKVPAGKRSANFWLMGKGGTKESTYLNESGANQDFTLTFSIKKTEIN